jgi:hypothetical protein
MVCQLQECPLPKNSNQAVLEKGSAVLERERERKDVQAAGHDRSRNAPKARNGDSHGSLSGNWRWHHKGFHRFWL